MQRLAARAPITVGVALVGAGVIAVAPIATSLPDIHMPEIQLTAGAMQDIVIDIVRHGERMSPFEQGLPGSPPYPGPPLSDLGQQQAQDVGDQLFHEFGGPNGVAGIFSGEGIRDTETAAPFATLEHMTAQILPGLDELDPGIYEYGPNLSLSTILYVLTPLLWSAGFELAPIPGSSDFNGVVFNEKFTDAIDTMYDHAMANPVVSDNGQITDVAFNNQESIVAWTLMNVKNPDLPFLLSTLVHSLGTSAPGFLPPGGIVQIEGSPADGWTLVSWNGENISQDPGLLTQLFVEFRDLIVAPQAALWHFLKDDILGSITLPDTAAAAASAGLHDIIEGMVQFPAAVVNDVVQAVQGLGSDIGGQAAAATATTLGDAFAL